MSFYSPAVIIRIWGIFLLISSTVCGWIALSHTEETRFWNIGSYMIESVSARGDDDDDDDEDEHRSSRRERDDDYVITEDSWTLPTQETTIITPTTTVVAPSVPRVVPSSPVAPVVSFDVRALQSLKNLGFSTQESQEILTQFQGFSQDMALKYPSTSWQITVLQKLIAQSDMKIAEIWSLSQTHPSTLFSQKEKSLRALSSIASIRVEMLRTPSNNQKVTSKTSTTTAPVATVKPKATTTSTTPTKTVTSVPVKQAAPVVQTQKPVVNTRTSAS